MTHPRLNRFGQATALAALLSFAALTHGWAHAFIDHTDPVVGSAVKQLPAQVRLWYTEGLEPAFSRVQVFDDAGRQIDKQDARLDAKNDHLLLVSLPPGLRAGTYKVVWQVVSVDTHRTQGSFTFRVEP